MTTARRTWPWWVAGAAFAAYPALRPYTDGSAAAELAAMSSTRWIVAHLLGMLGFALLPVGLAHLRDGKVSAGPRTLQAAAGLAYAGVVGVLPYYGGEAFALHAVGAYATRTTDPALTVVVDGFRYQPAAITLFGVGLVALAAAGALVGVATWRSASGLRVAGALVAVGLLTYLPQFYGPPPVRMAHGLLLALGCWAFALGQASVQGSRTSLPRT